MMQWFTRWRERREMKRLRRRFDDFLSRKPNWGGPDKQRAFIQFCELESLGVERVREIVNQGYA